MTSFAPRISPLLVEALVRLDDPVVPIAEVNRRLGAEAERLRLPRPSYQRVRELVHEVRRIRRKRGKPAPTTTGVLLDVIFQLRPPTAFADHLYGSRLPPLRS